MTNLVSSPADTERILDAAEMLLERYGYKRMTMEDLAQAVGLSKGALYLRFSGKEQVAISTLERVSRRLRDRLNDLVARPGDPVQRLRSMLRERVIFKFDSVKGYCESFDDVFAAIRPHIMKCREDWLELEAAIFARAIELGQKDGVFRLGDPTAAAMQLMAATKGLLPYRMLPDELGKREDLERRTEELINFLMQAIEVAK